MISGQQVLFETVDDTTYTGAVEGAVLQVWNSDKSEMIDEQTVDESGYVTFAELEAGDYVLVEAEAPEHFVIAGDIAFTVNKDGSSQRKIRTMSEPMERHVPEMKDEMEDGPDHDPEIQDDGKTPLQA